MLSVCLLLLERKYFGRTRDDVRRLDFQAAQNTISNPFSVAKGAAGRNWFRCFMKRHGHKLVRQPPGTSIAIAAGFSREHVGIFFDL
jgi:hypothetical protein